MRLLYIPSDVIEATIAQEISDDVLKADTGDGSPCVFVAPLY